LRRSSGLGDATIPNSERFRRAEIKQSAGR
jgi:hypothetical protein